MKIVYIAGPFRASTQWQVTCNIHRAAKLGAEVAKLGAMPLIPHRNTADFEGLQPDEFWLEGTLKLMRRCDAIILVPGWERSTGTKLEIEEAQRLGLPVFETLDELQLHLGSPTGSLEHIYDCRNTTSATSAEDAAEEWKQIAEKAMQERGEMRTLAMAAATRIHELERGDLSETALIRNALKLAADRAVEWLNTDDPGSDNADEMLRRAVMGNYDD